MRFRRGRCAARVIDTEDSGVCVGGAVDRGWHYSGIRVSRKSVVVSHIRTILTDTAQGAAAAVDEVGISAGSYPSPCRGACACVCGITAIGPQRTNVLERAVLIYADSRIRRGRFSVALATGLVSGGTSSTASVDIPCLPS